MREFHALAKCRERVFYMSHIRECFAVSVVQNVHIQFHLQILISWQCLVKLYLDDERERETDRQTDRQRQRQTDRDREREHANGPAVNNKQMSTTIPHVLQ